MFAPTIGFAGLLRSPGWGLLGADGTRVWGIGGPRSVTLVFGLAQRQPRLSGAPQQQVDTGDQVLELLVGGIPQLLVGEQPLIVG